MPLEEITREHGIKAANKMILAAFACHGYHHHVPNYKPFLSETTNQTRYTFLIANWDWPKEYWCKGVYYNETSIRSNVRQ